MEEGRQWPAIILPLISPARHSFMLFLDFSYLFHVQKTNNNPSTSIYTRAPHTHVFICTLAYNVPSFGKYKPVNSIILEAKCFLMAVEDSNEDPATFLVPAMNNDWSTFDR